MIASHTIKIRSYRRIAEAIRTLQATSPVLAAKKLRFHLQRDPQFHTWCEGFAPDLIQKAADQIANTQA